jgi:hypothetical protein
MTHRAGITHDVVTGDGDSTSRRRERCRQDRNGRRLARAIWPKQREKRPCRHGERDIVHRSRFGFLLAFDQVIDNDDRRAIWPHVVLLCLS